MEKIIDFVFSVHTPTSIEIAGVIIALIYTVYVSTGWMDTIVSNWHRKKHRPLFVFIATMLVLANANFIRLIILAK